MVRDMNTMDRFRDIDFVVLDEDFSRFSVHDGTTIKAKIVVRKILFSITRTPEGLPSNFGIESMDAVTAIVPKKLKRKPSRTKWDPNKDKGQEIPVEEQDTKVQSYMTSNGFKITVKPVVTKVLRYNKYNSLWEPIYKISVQAITDIKKIKNPPKNFDLK